MLKNLIGTILLVPILLNFIGGNKVENNTIIELINAYELDTDYNHTPWFSSKTAQQSWFRNKVIPNGIIDNNMYQRKDGNYIIEMSLSELQYCSYMIARNSTNEVYYYFVIDKEYVSDDMTRLLLQLDVIQTYMFDFTIQNSLIEREHIDRWDSSGVAKPLFIDENLETGEYVLKNKSTIYDYRNKGTYFITSSDRLGISNDGRPGETTPPSRASWRWGE